MSSCTVIKNTTVADSLKTETESGLCFRECCTSSTQRKAVAYIIFEEKVFVLKNAAAGGDVYIIREPGLYRCVNYK